MALRQSNATIRSRLGDDYFAESFSDFKARTLIL